MGEQTTFTDDWLEPGRAGDAGSAVTKKAPRRGNQTGRDQEGRRSQESRGRGEEEEGGIAIYEKTQTS